MDYILKHRISVMPNHLDHRKYICATLCAPLHLLSHTVLPSLNWYSLNCNQKTEYSKSQIPVPDSALCPG